MDVDDVRPWVEAVAPDGREQVPTRHRGTALFREREEQVELNGRQVKTARVDDRVPVHGIEVDAGDADSVEPLRRPAKDRAHSRQQLSERERLHEVVVGAALEPIDAIGHAVTGRKDQDGHRVTRVAQAAEHVIAAAARDHDVEDDGIEARRRDRPERRVERRRTPESDARAMNRAISAPVAIAERVERGQAEEQKRDRQ